MAAQPRKLTVEERLARVEMQLAASRQRWRVICALFDAVYSLLGKYRKALFSVDNSADSMVNKIRRE